MRSNIQITAVLAATLLFTACKNEATPMDGESQSQSTSTDVIQKTRAEESQAGTSAPLPERVKELEGKKPVKQQTPMQSTTITGTVIYKDLEGGFFALITEDGQRYLLQGMAEKYRQHGMVVKVTGKPRPDVMTIQQFGTPFEVSDVEIVDDSMVKPINNEM